MTDLTGEGQSNMQESCQVGGIQVGGLRGPSPCGFRDNYSLQFSCALRIAESWTRPPTGPQSPSDPSSPHMPGWQSRDRLYLVQNGLSLTLLEIEPQVIA